MTSEPEHAEVDLAHLHEPTSKNPNVMSSEDFTILTAAIRREGFLQPVLARPRLIERGGSYEIIDGVHRCKAAAAAGLVSVPCIIVDVDDDTAVMLRIAMNKLRGELDLATVARQVEALRADHSIEDLLVTGYTEKALKDLLEMAAEDRPEDALAQMGADPSEAAPEEERDPDAPAFTLEIALLVTRREFLSIKRKLRKLGGGDMGAGLIHLMNEEEA